MCCIVLSWLQDDNIIVENLKKEDTIFDKFDVRKVNQSQFTTWEVLIYLLTKISKGYALPSVIHLQDYAYLPTLNFILPGKRAILVTGKS